MVELAKEPDDSIAVEIRPKLSLMIVAIGDDAPLVAKRLRSSVRAPRADELGAIRPARIVPRALWSP